MIGIQFSFYFEFQISPFFYFPGITFRYSELYFQWSHFGQSGYYSGGGGVCSRTDLPQSDDTVEWCAEFGHVNVGFDIFDISVKGGKFGFYLFVCFFTDRISF